MNTQAFLAVVQNEIRVRARRLSTLVSILFVIAISWMIVADPATGRSMMVVDRARAVYDSTTLALGTSILASFLFGLGAFFLVRGRTREDLTYGMGSIIAATPIGNAAFLFARWCGAVAYMLVLMLALMATTMVLQMVRGVGMPEPVVYLQMYALFLLPTIFFAASIAVLCDSWSPLMGKGGDVFYFFLWIAQFSIFPQMIERNKMTLGALAAFDLSGLATTFTRFNEMFHTKHFSVGGSSFDASLPTVVLTDFWTGEMALTRLACMLMAMLPLIPALLLFHRFSPDKVKAVTSNKRGSIWAWINRIVRPITTLTRPLYAIAAQLPGVVGQTLADVAITLSANPALFAGMIVITALGFVMPATSLSGLLGAAIACWGILISDLSIRDHQNATHAMTAAVPGGSNRRYWRQLAVTLLLGVIISAPIGIRWLLNLPTQAAALVTGLIMLSAAATLLGRLTHTGRTFLGLFLFGLYLAMQVRTVRWFDVVGFNAHADVTTMSTYLACGLVMAALGFVVTQRNSA